MRYFIELAYDGTNYHGWQSQAGSVTVQEALELGLRYKAGLKDRITGCGRTDAGVHAKQFFAHFDHNELMEPDSLAKLTGSLNNFLPADIAVRRIFRVRSDAHARFDAVSRTYQYFIQTTKNPFNRDYAWHLCIKPDVALMNRAATVLMSYQDFTSFSKLHTDVKTNICNISKASWEQADGQLVFTITADRFLRNMVRAIVGTLLDIGRNKISPDDLKRIIESKNRQKAGMSAPAHGLFLQRVEYIQENILPNTKGL
jgi:tRNA pseudouridine38-40 synthase